MRVQGKDMPLFLVPASVLRKQECADEWFQVLRPQDADVDYFASVLQITQPDAVPRMLDAFGNFVDAAGELIALSRDVQREVTTEIFSQYINHPGFRDELGPWLPLGMKFAQVVTTMSEEELDEDFSAVARFMGRFDTFLEPDAPGSVPDLLLRDMTEEFIERFPPPVLAALLERSQSPLMRHPVTDPKGNVCMDFNIFKFYSRYWMKYAADQYDGFRITGTEFVSSYLSRDWVQENAEPYTVIKPDTVVKPAPRPAGLQPSNG